MVYFSQYIAVTPAQFRRRHHAQSHFVADQDPSHVIPVVKVEQGTDAGQDFSLHIAFTLKCQQQVTDPDCQAVQQQCVLAGQGGGDCSNRVKRFLQGIPGNGAAIAVFRYAPPHIVIQGLGSRDKQRSFTLPGKLLCTRALAGARPAQYQNQLFFHVHTFDFGTSGATLSHGLCSGIS